MHVLVLHNQYQYAGGEDASVSAEIGLLKNAGHRVTELTVSNQGLDDLGLVGKLRLALHATWSVRQFRKLLQLCRDVRPDVAHIHNTWPNLSPSVSSACHAARVPVVQSIHNFRLLCLNGLFFRHNAECYLCLRVPLLPGIVNRCYRGSIGASGAVAMMLAWNRLRRSWARDVDTWIALSRYSKDLICAAGLPPSNVVIKPNFCFPPNRVSGGPECGTVLFVGRLSEEKGIGTLLEAWRMLRADNRKLRIVGDGPERSHVDLMVKNMPSVQVVGWCDKRRVAEEMQRASLVVVPSLVPETFGRTIAEAWSCARPVLVSNIGSLAESVQGSEAGWLFEAGNAKRLAHSLEHLLSTPNALRVAGEIGLSLWATRYSPEENYRALIDIYESSCRKAARFYSNSSGLDE